MYNIRNAKIPFVYETTNLDPESPNYGFKYRGKHCAVNPHKVEDCYYGSTNSTIMKDFRETRKRVGSATAKTLYSRKVIKILHSEDEAYDYERKVVNSKWLDRDDILNRERGGCGNYSGKRHPRFGAITPLATRILQSQSTIGYKHWRATQVKFRDMLFGSARELARWYKVAYDMDKFDKEQVLQRCRSRKPKWDDWSVVSRTEYELATGQVGG